jgi:hypothetical protein
MLSAGPGRPRGSARSPGKKDTMRPALAVIALFLPARAALAAGAADPDSFLVLGFEDASRFAVHDDNGQPPGFDLSSTHASGRRGLRSVYRQGRSGWGNIRTPARLRDIVEAVSFQVYPERVSAGAHVNLWFFESDGDGWTAAARLDALPPGWSRMRMDLSDFRYEKRGDGRPDISKVHRMLIGFSGADATIVLDDLRYEGRRLRARWEALMARPSEVAIDLRETVVESFVGIGVQWDPYSYPPSPEKMKLITNRLDRLEPAFFRLMHNAGAYCREIDAAGEPSYLWRVDGAKAPEALREFDQVYAILEYAQSRGWYVMIGEWGPPWVKVAGKWERFGTDDPRWARIVADYVAHLLTHLLHHVLAVRCAARTYGLARGAWHYILAPRRGDGAHAFASLTVGGAAIPRALRTFEATPANSVLSQYTLSPSKTSTSESASRSRFTSAHSKL